MFVQRCNEYELQKLYETAQEASEIIKKTNQNYWLSHGSLLGAIRHNSVVPWDDDLDIAYPRECLESLIKIVNENDWKFTRLGPFHAKIWNEKIFYR